MTEPQRFQGLPLDLEDLLHRRTVESHRVEFKASWNAQIKAAVVRTLCAFANDVLNLNGGYVVLGVEERQGRPVLPPRGLEALDLDRLQREIRGVCRRIDPEYQPYLFPAEHGGRTLLVLWAPGGDNRPYQAPEDIGKKGSPRHFYMRQGAETVRAQGDHLRRLVELTARVPFDDRRNPEARVEDISPAEVRHFLRQIDSALIDVEPPLADVELYRRLRLVVPVNAHDAPRNVALLFFSDEPHLFFPGARIEVVRFADDAGGDLIEERSFHGPLPLQIRRTLDHLAAVGGTLVRKLPDRPEAERTAAYPEEAVEEAIVNGVYHRSYDDPPEPLKVYLYPDRMEVTTYPGPVLGLEHEHFASDATLPPVPARNRRIGELLKELRLAEARGTGIPKIRRSMGRNGSPPPTFDFDDARTYFRVILPIHPQHRDLAGSPRSTAKAPPTTDLEAALGKLKLRLAAGEISLEEYREIKAELIGGS